MSKRKKNGVNRKSTVALDRVDDYRWRVPRTGSMRVDGLIYASDRLMNSLRDDPALDQVAAVASLPGIIGSSLAMPDAHWGYGFPIGGVAAFDEDEGVVSPGGVGYDINCGVRLLRSNIERQDVVPIIRELVEELFRAVPTGVGAHRREDRLSSSDQRDVLRKGAAWAVERGYGWSSDLDFIEERGILKGADPDAVSDRAMERGRGQLGTLGSGNHFIEIGYVDSVYDLRGAETLGLREGTVTVMIHSGSRGLGYQVCDDAVKGMVRAAAKYGIDLPDRQLCCAPLHSPEAREYLAAMACAANYAFANRQRMAHEIRGVFERVLGISPRDHGLHTVYDLCHNIAKFERHEVMGREQRVCVHRKGATRAFPPGHADLPAKYGSIGQPVLIPGDMGRYSFVLLGRERAMAETFGSACHGAGRLMSRSAARRAASGKAVARDMEGRGITVRSAGLATLSEEMPGAYKDVADVVDVVHGAGLAGKTARLAPLGVIKG